MPLILAVDLGTSAVKVGLVSARGELVAWEAREYPLRRVERGGFEQSPHDWWRAVVEAIQALTRDSVVAKQVTAISVSSQWSGTVAVDERHQAIGDAIIWMDTRGAAHVRRVARGLISPGGYGLTKLRRWIDRTGGLPSLSGKDTLAHILYLRAERPDVYRAAYKFLEPMDYVNLRLTGRAATSSATATLTWCTDNRDLGRVEYDESLLKIAGIEREKLPSVVAPAGVFAPILPGLARELGLRDEVQVVSGTPDVHTSAIGSGAVKDREAHLSIGSSSWIAAHYPKKKTELAKSLAALPSAMPTRYLVICAQESAGLCVGWCRDQLFSRDTSLAELDALAATAPAGCGGVLFTPWINGERMPLDDSRVRGGFAGISLDTTRAELARAVLEGVALNTRWVIDHVESFLGRKIEALPAVGGGAASRIWCQIFADVLGRPVKQVRDARLANVRGAGLIGAVAMGYCTFDQVAELVPIEETFEPERAVHEVYDERYAEFLRLARESFARAKAVAVSSSSFVA